jgi:uncharacterized protein YecE (DUF72 family)
VTGDRKLGEIRAGVGGWTFDPWRNNFYPAGLSHRSELGFASRRFSAIEINATFYRTQTADSFRRWADETPTNFIFSVKAHRLTTHRKRLAESGPSVERFIGSGLLGLGEKLGPIVWQFAPGKRFEPDDFEAFLRLLPTKADGRGLRHVLEVRHQSFAAEGFTALARRYACAICLSDSDVYPIIADVSADFVYARLQRSSAAFVSGYPPRDIARWADRARLWAEGRQPDDLPALSGPAQRLGARDVFIFFIAGAKDKNPAAAQALIKRVGAAGSAQASSMRTGT